MYKYVWFNTNIYNLAVKAMFLVQQIAHQGNLFW